MKWKYFSLIILFCLSVNVLAQNSPYLDSPILTSPTDGETDVNPNTTLRWDPSDDPSSDDVSYYTVEIDDPDGNAVSGTPTNVSGTTFTASLSGSTTYTWYLTAYNTQDKIQSSATESDFTTADATKPLPSAPVIHEAVALDDGISANFSWAASDNGSNTYTVTISVNNYLIYNITSNADATSLTYSPLSPGVTYSWYVTATNSTGQSQPSAPGTLSMPPGTITPGNIVYGPGGPGTSIAFFNQQYSAWCWNACCQTLLTLYKKPNVVQTDIATYALGNSQANYGVPLSYGKDEDGNPIYGIGTIAKPHADDEILHHFQSALSPIYSPGYFTRGGIQTAIINQQPIMVARIAPAGSNTVNHAVVIYGYNNVQYNDNGGNITAGQLVYWDPNSNTIGTPLYEEFVASTQYNLNWNGSLQMNVSPSSVHDGIKDYVQVSRPVKIPAISDTATFAARFVDSDHSGTVAKSWDWRLVLFHDKGDVTIVPPVKGMISQDPLYCNWSAKIGTLPQGYNWKRDADGQIIGEVEVGCLDSDPPFFYHHAAIKVAFNDGSNTIIIGDNK